MVLRNRVRWGLARAPCVHHGVRVGSNAGGGHGAGASPRLTGDQLRAHCLSLPGAWQDEPWEGDVVAKVADKIFAFLGSGTSVGVKCGANREEADEWLLQYPDHAHAMAYIGRSGWNTLDLGGAIPDVEILEAVDTSYATVVAKLPRSRRPAAGG
jgi:predicted DNA-binding protein (MmcQ/YjbR family)